MLMQFGTFLANALQPLLTQTIPSLITAAAPVALGIGQQFVQGLALRELNRSAVNAQQDQVKALLRAASNAVSPVVAPGQTAVYSGGPPIGSAFQPATLLPPSIVPPQQILAIDPNFSTVSRGAADVVTSGGQLVKRGTPSVSASELRGQPGVTPTPVFFGGAVRAGGQLLRRLGRGAGAFDPRTPIGRQMLGAGAAAVAIEAGAATLGGAIFDPSVAHAPNAGFSTLQPTGDPFRIGGSIMPHQAAVPTATGLPSVGRYQREANGCNVQWFFFNGTDMQPIDRSQAKDVKKGALYRLDVFLGKFLQLGRRRMNPMNVRAFFRAGRRVDAGERICRKMFSEKRKQKTGTIRRKSRRKKK